MIIDTVCIDVNHLVDLQGDALSTEESGPTTVPDEATVQRLIDFVRADVVTQMIYPPRPTLVVSGATNIPVDVTLVPLVYVSQPRHWGIQVVGCTDDSGPRPTQPIAAIPYSVQLDLAGVIGTEGVEVIGATMTEQIAVPTGEEVDQPETEGRG